MTEQKTAVTRESLPFHYSTSGDVAFLPAMMAVVSGLPSTTSMQTGQRAAPTNPVIRRELMPGDDRIAFWGDGNDFPQQVIQRYNKNPLIPETLDKKAAMWLGGGLMACENEEATTMVPDPEIRAFMTSISTKRYQREQAKDFAWLANGFPEMILSKNREKIVQLHSNETAFCRWGRMNEQTGEMDRVYLNANWPQASSLDPHTIELPALNPYAWDLEEQIRSGKFWKYIYPLSYPSIGTTYYQLANHNTIISSEWLSVLEAIPQFKKYAIGNQMSLLYHIEVSEEYWKKVYGDEWINGDFNAKMAIKDRFLTGLNEKLTNVKGAHSSIMTDRWLDHAGNEQGIKINVLKDIKVDGKFSEDYSDGTALLLYSLGVDPTLVGYASKDIQRSGGSDKREAFWIFISQSMPVRQVLVEPFEVVASYNGWRKRWPELTFKFRDTALTTLDTGKSTATSATAA